MESISKSRIQGGWDPAHSTRTRIIAHSTMVGIPSGCRHFPPGCITSGILLLPPPFHPDVSHPEICCRHHSIRMSYIRNSGAGWERRAFQLLQIYIFGSSNSAHPESFAAILHSADSAHPESFAAHFAQCHGVLLKLPDMCDRHLRYFSHSAAMFS